MFVESPTCLLAFSHQTCLLIFFFKQWLFSGHSPIKLCGVYGLKWSYGQILQSPLWSFAAPSGWSLVSLFPLWLMPSLPGLWVLVGGPLLAGLLWCHILSIFFIMDLIVLRGMNTFARHCTLYRYASVFNNIAAKLDIPICSPIYHASLVKTVT